MTRRRARRPGRAGHAGEGPPLGRAPGRSWAPPVWPSLGCACRLLDALQRGPRRQHLALPLLLLVAQQRQAIMVGARDARTHGVPLPSPVLISERTACQASSEVLAPRGALLDAQIQTQAQHIKFVVELYDKCHETCVQYIQFLQVCMMPPRAAGSTRRWQARWAPSTGCLCKAGTSAALLSAGCPEPRGLRELAAILG